MGLPGSEIGVIFQMFSFPLCASLQFSRTAFSFLPNKKSENIPDHEEVISDKKRLHIHTEGALRPAKVKDAHICSEILMTQMASSVVEDSQMLGPSKLMVHFLRLSETSVKIILDF